MQQAFGDLSDLYHDHTPYRGLDSVLLYRRPNGH